MFTGLVEQQGRVQRCVINESSHRLWIAADFEGLHAGESIAVNGVCLTLLPDFTQVMCFDVSQETLACTSLGTLCEGDPVNLERAMLASTRFGGHYVSGHVDTTVRVESIEGIDEYLQMSFCGFDPTHQRFLLPKGSITLDGVSLTINVVEEGRIKVLLVPHTLKHTLFGQLTVGDRVNVEFDYLTRIVAHQLNASMLGSLSVTQS